MPKTMPVEVTVTVGGRVIGPITIYTDDPKKIAVDVSPVKPKLPKRSPLHEKALNMDDIKPNLNIERRNVRHPSHRATAIVIGEPFRRGSKYLDHWDRNGTHAKCWMVPVVTTNYAGKQVMADWYLADMGIVPYTWADDGIPRWNEQNYTLAAE